jgi:PfaB family protein
MNGIITGMAASYGGHPSLTSIEAALFQGESLLSSSPAELSRVAERALEDAGISSRDRCGLILLTQPGDSTDLFLSENQDIFILEKQAGDVSIPGALSTAAEFLRKQPQHQVLILVSDSIGVGAFVISQPESTQQGYARLALDGIHPDTDGGLESISTKWGEYPPEYLQMPADPAYLNKDRWEKLAHLWPLDPPHRICALGGVSTSIEDDSGMAGFIQAVLTLHRRTIPGFPKTLRTQLEGVPAGGPFYAPESPRPWLDHGTNPRRSLMLFSSGAGLQDILLEEALYRKSLPRIRTGLVPGSKVLLPFSGQSLEDLQASLQGLLRRVEEPEPLNAIAARRLLLGEKKHARLRGCILAEDREKIRKEIKLLQKGLERSLKSGKQLTTPAGSCFVPQPLGDQGTALIYPGAFNSYPGMGRELFQIFPGLHEMVKKTTGNIRQSLAEALIYPRSLSPLSESDRERLQENFFEQPIDLIESGTSLAVLHTLILKDIFSLEPRAAFGYSLGEISMLWANGIWRNGEKSSLKWRRSALFKERLFGSMTAVRDYWTPDEFEDAFWGSYILKASPQECFNVLEKEPKAFLTIINTPDEVVIAGEQNACQRVIKALGCRSLPMPFQACIHNPAMAGEYPAFVDLLTESIFPAESINFYSAARYQPLSLDSQEIGRSLAGMICRQVDFPRLVEQVYRDGIRLFIEVGPQKTCTRWIETILKDRPHAVCAINKKYQPDLDGILKVLAQLISHRVPLQLDPLIAEQPPGWKSVASQGNRNGQKLTRQQQTIKAAAPGTLPEQPSTKADPPREQIAADRFEMLARQSSRLANAQRSYFSSLKTLTGNLSRALQLVSSTSLQKQSRSPSKRVLFTHDQIAAFTLGDPSACFGHSYSPFAGQRIPLLPNGKMQFLDRVVELNAAANLVQPGASLRAEYDLPQKAWYLANRTGLPYVALLEIALQPCGFLSAYMGSILSGPKVDYYFRNLDGQAELTADPPPPGSTISTRVELTTASTLQSTIIQHYNFELSSSGRMFFRGKASFGYFPSRMLSRQKGIDGGQQFHTFFRNHPDTGRWFSPGGKPDLSPREASLPPVTRYWFAPAGGEYQAGSLYLTEKVDPQAWFFKAHFHQDPVMPGSLGVELMSQTIQAAADQLGQSSAMHWRIKPEEIIRWKYRGQITRKVETIQLEIHLKEVNQTGSRLEITGDGNLLREDLRIYQISNLALIGENS